MTLCIDTMCSVAYVPAHCCYKAGFFLYWRRRIQSVKSMTLHCNSNHSQKPIFPNGGCKPPSPQSRPGLLLALQELVPGNHVQSMPCVLAFARFLAFLPHPQEKKSKEKGQILSLFLLCYGGSLQCCAKCF